MRVTGTVVHPGAPARGVGGVKLMHHVVALSGGADSSAMALRLAEVEPDTSRVHVCTPTGNELPAMVDHWCRLRDALGGLIGRWNALPNWRQRWCTRELKLVPFQRYISAHLPCTVYVGIRADEASERDGAEWEGEVTRRFPLVEWGWDRAAVLAYLEARGVQIPARTDCAACFYQTLYEWWSLWKHHPDHWAQAEAWEAQTGHTFRSARRDTHPAALAGLRAEFEAGYIPARRGMAERSSMCSTCAR